MSKYMSLKKAAIDNLIEALMYAPDDAATEFLEKSIAALRAEPSHKRFTFVEGSINIGGTLHDVYKDNDKNAILVIEQSALEQGMTIHHPYTGEEIDTDSDELFDDL